MYKLVFVHIITVCTPYTLILHKVCDLTHSMQVSHFSWGAPLKGYNVHLTPNRFPNPHVKRAEIVDNKGNLKIWTERVGWWHRALFIACVKHHRKRKDPLIRKRLNVRIKTRLRTEEPMENNLKLSKFSIFIIKFHMKERLLNFKRIAFPIYLCNACLLMLT